LHFFTGVAVAIGCALAPWSVARLPTRWAAIAALPLLVVIVVGAAAGLSLFPFSDVVVAIFAVLAGTVLGRVMPPRFRPMLAVLAALSVLDVAQNLAFAGPSTPSGSTGTDAHLIWLNFRIPLSVGHFNIGLADMLLIAAVGENLRRRTQKVGLSLLPGVIAIGLGEALLSALPSSPPPFVVALSASLVLFLTAGYALTELAVSQTAA
jgi:hypothetical protein